MMKCPATATNVYHNCKGELRQANTNLSAYQRITSADSNFIILFANFLRPASAARNPIHRARLFSFPSIVPLVLVLGMLVPCFAAPAKTLAPVPAMRWNDWAHYECKYTAHTILANAKAPVSSGLATLGYNVVTIDDCWMEKDRGAHGNLQMDAHRFPPGVKPVAQAVHALGLKLSIYEDAATRLARNWQVELNLGRSDEAANIWETADNAFRGKPLQACRAVMRLTLCSVATSRSDGTASPGLRPLD
jgi:hypothetical protein